MLCKEKKIMYLFLFAPFYIFSSSSNKFEHRVQMPSENKLNQDFKKEGFESFAKKTGIVPLVAGKTLTDTDLISIGIHAQLTYKVEEEGFFAIPVFNKNNQNKIYSILFQNNLELLRKFQEQGIL